MTKLKTLAFAVIGLLLAAPAFGQTALNQTRLSAAVTSSSTRTVVVVSATGITAPSTAQTYIYVDNELMFVNNVSSTTLTVQRGAGGTTAQPHISGARVLAGPPAAFVAYDPSGACTNGQGLFLYSPIVSYKDGLQWLCSTVTGEITPGFGNGPPSNADVTTAVASVAGATNPSGPLFHVTGTNAITAWGSSTTAGAVGMGGGSSDAQGEPFCVIPDAIFTTTATNNIALASTAVVNKLLCYTWDGTNKKYVPSY